MGAQLAPAHHDGRGSKVEHLLAASWCATVAPERAGRAALPERRRALRWVSGLCTRSGTPRAIRIATCGRPRAVLRDGDWCPSWCHAWCRDRACPACAQSRSRQLAVELRRCVELRESRPLYFVTLTRPRRPSETAAQAWREYQRAWEALRHRPEFRELAGGVRIVEVTHASQGWHVHCHCIFELVERPRRVACPTCNGSRVLARRVREGWRTQKCRTCSSSTQPGDGTMPLELVDLLRAWTSIVDGSTAAQCAVELDDANAGQLAKYLTKLWDLPDDKARELFAAAAGRRLLNTFGSWHGRNGLHVRANVERLDRDWWQGLLVAEIEAMHPRSYIYFGASVSGVLLQPTSTTEATYTRDAHVPVGKKPPHRAERPWLAVARMTAGKFLRMLKADDRRADEHDALPKTVARPGREMLRAAGSRDGPWSVRTLGVGRRLKNPAVIAPRELADEQPPWEPLRPWPAAFEAWARFDAQNEIDLASEVIEPWGF